MSRHAIRAEPRQPDWGKLVTQNLRLVRYVLHRLVGHLPASVDREDLVEAGFIGLIDAARRFDPERGVKFDTYAVPRVRGAMLDELRAHNRIQVSLQGEPAGAGGDERGGRESASYEPDPRERVEFEEQKHLLAAAIGNLPAHEQAVIRLYYFERRLLREIGAKLGLCNSRVWQLHRSALKRLRFAMRQQEMPTIA